MARLLPRYWTEQVVFVLLDHCVKLSVVVKRTAAVIEQRDARTASLAQLGEQLVYTQQVGGSSPSGRTNVLSRDIVPTVSRDFFVCGCGFGCYLMRVVGWSDIFGLLGVRSGQGFLHMWVRLR